MSETAKPAARKNEAAKVEDEKAELVIILCIYVVLNAARGCSLCF